MKKYREIIETIQYTNIINSYGKKIGGLQRKRHTF